MKIPPFLTSLSPNPTKGCNREGEAGGSRGGNEIAGFDAGRYGLSPGVASKGRGFLTARSTSVSSKMELTHPVMVASSAGTLQRCVKHIAEGGRSERDLRDEGGGPFDPRDCLRVGRVPQHGPPVPEVP